LQWRNLFLSVTICFVVVEPDQKHFRATKLRNQVAQEHSSMTRSTFQQICEVNIFKELIEGASNRKMTAGAIAHEFNTSSKRADCQEEIKESFVDSAITLWNRAFSHQEVLTKIRECEELYGLSSPFEGISKLQAIVSKSGTAINIIWTFTAIADFYKYGLIAKEGLGARDLNGAAPGRGGKGVVEELVYKKDTLEWFRGEWLAEQAFDGKIKDSIRHACASHENIRLKCGCPFAVGLEVPEPDLTWQAGWPESAVKTMELVMDIWEFPITPHLQQTFRKPRYTYLNKCFKRFMTIRRSQRNREGFKIPRGHIAIAEWS
jgi:hypothetical protein